MQVEEEGDRGKLRPRLKSPPNERRHRSGKKFCCFVVRYVRVLLDTIISTEIRQIISLLF